jgi:2-succinyl-6-hydroxy-2,4-cyclohexadiene-1-carboxylate synthase
VNRVRAGDSELAVRIAGAGRPLLLLHGFTGSGATWDELAAAWSGERRTIAPDLLGHGASEAPRDPARYELRRQAADLAALVEGLGGGTADVIGYSMGARLALWLALEHPATVGRLVLESPSAGIADPAERARRRAADEDLAGFAEREGIGAFVERWTALPLFASQARLPGDVRDRVRRERLANTAAGLAASLRGAGQGAMPPLHDRLAEIGRPPLVVAGALDPTGVARAREVAAAIPGARLEVVADAGHAPHLERPGAFGDLVRAFLADTATPAGAAPPTAVPATSRGAR